MIHSPGYDIALLGLERLHPFDGRNYTRAWQTVHRTYGAALERHTLRPPRPIEHDKLLVVQTPEYLARLQSRHYVAQVMELPILAYLPMNVVERHVLRPMRLGTMGTLMAAREALRGGPGGQPSWRVSPCQLRPGRGLPRLCRCEHRHRRAARGVRWSLGKT